MAGSLYLIPSTLGDTPTEQVIPGHHKVILNRLREFIVEDIRSSRRFLKRIDKSIEPDNLNFQLLNEHTSEEDIPCLLDPLRTGKDMGLLSEAGLPCVADPGATLVRIAHDENMNVIPLSGPSSIFLALMASGFNGQNFAFHGYLPRDMRSRTKKLKELERISAQTGQTQIFIETPYRNKAMLETILHCCGSQTHLCIAAGLTTNQEFISTKSIMEWRKTKRPEIHKIPAVFLLQ